MRKQVISEKSPLNVIKVNQCTSAGHYGWVLRSESGFTEKGFIIPVDGKWRLINADFNRQLSNYSQHRHLGDCLDQAIESVHLTVYSFNNSAELLMWASTPVTDDD